MKIARLTTTTNYYCQQLTQTAISTIATIPTPSTTTTSNKLLLPQPQLQLKTNYYY